MDTSAILNYLRLTSHYAALLARLLTLPLRLLIGIPLSYLARVLRIVFFPVLYLAAYVAGWCRGIVDFITALQLATAALVGAFTGLTLATSSTVITSYLGMQGDASSNGSRSAHSRTPPHDKDPLSSYYSSPNTLVKDDSSSNEGEWYWPDPSPSRRRPATGLLSQTILEEEDDSDV
ncbi:hypothetical protein CCMA1212_002469 [Trichoderma ghanense]|uniref:Uncharacterized protein n=1 Tax=Trichoderma ghanense TaxID=65468 RepID=A0ABY2HBB7_9HYPO